MRMDITKSRTFGIVKSIVDVMIILSGFYFSFYIRYGQNIQERNIRPFFVLMPYIAMVSLFFFYLYLPNRDDEKSYIEMAYSSVLTVIMIQITTMAMSFFIRGFAFPRMIFAISGFLQVSFFLIWNKMLKNIYRKYGKENRILLVGDEACNRKVAENMLRLQHGGVRIAGEVGTCDAVDDEAMDAIDSLYLTSDMKDASRKRILELAISKNKNIYIAPSLYEIILSNSKLTQFDDIPVFKVRHLSLSLEQRLFKRSFDLILTFPGLLVASPFMLFAAMMIKVQDQGPVFYKQERLTEGGRLFEVIKFRTMVIDAEKKSGPVLAEMDDPRITKTGKFLRAYRLDELPQLFNVIKGDMSLVGPRPERAFFYEMYEKEIPQFKYRLSVKPGVTGLGQILGKYTTSPKDKLAYDLLYIYEYSLISDMKILLKTIQTVFRKSGAEGL